jgi:hypothetical protein
LQTQRLVTVKNCQNAFESAFLKAYLVDNGIRTWDSGEEQSAWTGRYSMLSRGARLRVMPQDADRAKKLLEHPPKFPETDIAEEDDAPSKPAKVKMELGVDGALLWCPNCRSKNIEELAPSLLARLFAGLFGHEVSGTWICRDCDWDSHR